MILNFPIFHKNLALQLYTAKKKISQLGRSQVVIFHIHAASYFYITILVYYLIFTIH